MAYDPTQQVPPPQGYPPQQPGSPPPGYQQPMAPQSPMAQQLGPSSIGIDPNISAALGYFTILGLIFFLIEKQNRFVRFHAFQGFLFGVGFWILGFVFDVLTSHFFVLYCFGGLLWIAWIVGAVYAAVQAYNGKWFKLPVVGDIAYNNTMAWNPVGGAPMAGPGTQYPPQGQQPPPYPGQ